MKVIFKVFDIWRAGMWVLFIAAMLYVEAARAQPAGTESVLHAFTGTACCGTRDWSLSPRLGISQRLPLLQSLPYCQASRTNPAAADREPSTPTR